MTERMPEKHGEGKDHFKRFVTKSKEDKKLGNYVKRAF